GFSQKRTAPRPARPRARHRLTRPGATMSWVAVEKSVIGIDRDGHAAYFNRHAPNGAMRILLCGINYAPDLIGTAKYKTELGEALSARGHEVHVVTAPPYYPAWKVPADYHSWRYDTRRSAGVRVKRVPIYIPGNPSGARRMLHHASFAMTSALPVIS